MSVAHPNIIRRLRGVKVHSPTIKIGGKENKMPQRNTILMDTPKKPDTPKKSKSIIVLPYRTELAAEARGMSRMES